MDEPQLAPIHPSEVVAFDMYFATLVGMHEHPGQKKDPVQKKTIRQCAALAIEMLLVRRTLIPTEQDNE